MAMAVRPLTMSFGSLLSGASAQGAQGRLHLARSTSSDSEMPTRASSERYARVQSPPWPRRLIVTMMQDAVVNVGFHPSAQLMYCTTEDRRAQFFKVDGVDNALLQSFHAQELPISSAAIHPAGTTLLLTGRRPFFITCDLQSGAMSRSPRGLLNEGLGGSEGSDASGGGLDRFAFSPDGSQLAIAGRRGYVHLLAWNADGSGCGSHVIGRVKTNAAVRSIAWRRNGAELVTLCDDSCLYTWDVGTRRCISKRPDEGGFGACSLALDANDRYAAVGYVETPLVCCDVFAYAYSLPPAPPPVS